MGKLTKNQKLAAEKIEGGEGHPPPRRRLEWGKTHQTRLSLIFRWRRRFVGGPL